jgi:hypothetical protein
MIFKREHPNTINLIIIDKVEMKVKHENFFKCDLANEDEID